MICHRRGSFCLESTTLWFSLYFACLFYLSTCPSIRNESFAAVIIVGELLDALIKVLLGLFKLADRRKVYVFDSFRRISVHNMEPGK